MFSFCRFIKSIIFWLVIIDWYTCGCASELSVISIEKKLNSIFVWLIWNISKTLIDKTHTHKHGGNVNEKKTVIVMMKWRKKINHFAKWSSLWSFKENKRLKKKINYKKKKNQNRTNNNLLTFIVFVNEFFIHSINHRDDFEWLINHCKVISKKGIFKKKSLIINTVSTLFVSYRY